MAQKDLRADGDDAHLDVELRNHQECMRVLSDLEGCFRHPIDAQGNWVAKMQDCFEAFSKSLRTYFKGEEHGRLYQEVPVRFPRLSGRVQKLKTEHTRMLEELDAVSAAFRDPSPDNAGDLRERAHRLLADIRRHESDETQLLQTAYWREVGTGD